jgi:hypothetical protein
MTTTHTFSRTEPVEIRFGSKNKQDRQWQLIASVNPSGTISYTLHSVPRGNYSFSLTYLVGETTTILPAKAYEGWQTQLIKWVKTLSLSGNTIYEISEVL